MKKIIAFLVIISIMLGNLIIASSEEDTTLSSSNVASDYSEYKVQNAQVNKATEEIVIKAMEFSSYEGTQPQADGEILYIPDGCTVKYKLNIVEAGMYNLALCYAATEGKGLTIERGIKINGKVPFDSAASIGLCRIFADAESFKKEGNEYRPQQKEQEVFAERYVTGSGIESDTVFEFNFESGENELELTYLSEPMKLKYIKLCRKEQVPSYSEYLSANSNNTAKASGEIKFQAEDTYLKSDASLFPLSDRSSAANEPISTVYTKLNSIGGENWSIPKQWISWKFTVKEDGWYNLGMRLRQNFNSGTVSNRSLYIDGQLPFAECEEISVKHSRQWQMFTPKNDEGSYKFYLTAGEHTITLYNSIGILSDVINRTNDSMTLLSSVYRQVMMITGPSPDAYRDYKIDKILPSAMTAFEEQSKELRAVCEELEGIAGRSSTGYASIQKLLIQLESFLEKPSSIPARLDSFRSNISDVSSWVLECINQPLLIDYFVFEPVGQEMPKANSGFFKNLVFGIEQFIQSFVNDYNNISFTDSEDISESITLWMGATVAATSGANVIGSGRDQATALKNLTDSYFIPQKKINVNVRLVDMASLLPAVASGMGPDVAIGQDRANPMNYAYRGALVNLSEFDDIKEATSDFFPEALTSFRYGDEIYALPETFAFSLMFYRTDVLSELGIEVPKTWDELYTIIPKLSNKYMTVGLPLLSTDSIELFLALLYQKGGEVYDKGYTKTLLDSEVSIEAFNEWTDFYTKYGVDQKVDLLTRFRTGESPIVITQYSFYNQIVATAPELMGKWDVTGVPGYDVNDNCVYGTGTGAVIFKNSKKKEEAWEFLKWWTSADIQVAFNQELEAILGESARIPTANAKALERLPWNSKMLNVIKKQSENAKGLPEVPGSYLTTRYLSMAARLVINNGVMARDSIMSYALQINDEIDSMRKEFGLD